MSFKMMKTIQLIWNYGFEYLVTGILGFIPSPMGAFLRNITYKVILDKIGLTAFIQPNVRLIGTKNIQIADGSRIYQGSYLSTKGNRITLKERASLDRGVDMRAYSGFDGFLEVGERTYLGPYVCLAGPGKIQIGNDCMIASHSSFYANNHKYGAVGIPIRNQGFTCKGIVIGNNCWLGSGVRVLDGVTIGTGCVIGAGAVVTRDIPPYSVAVGVPAKVIKNYNRISHEEKTLVASPEMISA